MYYDLCPWRYCGCPFCVEEPPPYITPRPSATTRSTLFPRQEETTEASPNENDQESTTPAAETTTDTTAADTELITTDLPTTTTEMIPQTETEPPPDTEEPITEPQSPATSRPRTTPGRSTTAAAGGKCTVCICGTWHERIHLWRPPQRPPRLHLRYTDTCWSCGQSWISASLGRKADYKLGLLSNRWTRRNTWLNGWRWRNPVGNSDWRRRSLYRQHRSQVEIFEPQRSLNQPTFTNRFLFF